MSEVECVLLPTNVVVGVVQDVIIVIVQMEVLANGNRVIGEN